MYSTNFPLLRGSKIGLAAEVKLGMGQSDEAAQQALRMKRHLLKEAARERVADIETGPRAAQERCILKDVLLAEQIAALHEPEVVVGGGQRLLRHTLDAQGSGASTGNVGEEIVEARITIEQAHRALAAGHIPMAADGHLHQELGLAPGRQAAHRVAQGHVVALHGIEDAVRQDGFSFLLNCAKNDPVQEMNAINALVARNVSGIIVISPNTKNISERFYEELVARVPLVFINGYHRIKGVSYVGNDEKLGSQMALEYLSGLGHKDIMFVRGANSDSYDIKEEAYRQFMEENGTLREDYILNIGEGNGVETVDSAMEALQAEGYFHYGVR